MGRRSSLAVAGLVALAACGRGDGSPTAERIPPFPPPHLSASVVDRDDFVGAEACAGCHADQYRAWSGSTHGLAGGPPGSRTVVAPFDGRAIPFADGTVTPRVRGGAYEFVVRQTGFADTAFAVHGVIGRGHMLGGGTQGFLTRMDDGTVRFLPWDWSVAAGTWFCNTGSRSDQGWVPITGELRMADCGDWPPLRPIGTVDRFANCQECHGSQISTEFDPAAGGYDTRYTTLRVNCESCHGPGARHVALAASDGFPPGGALGLKSLAYRSKDESLGVCFQCHALKDVLREGYLPGEPLGEYYALKFAVLGDRPYLADGRIRSFAYQGNHLASACYLQGPMECASCHEPHGLGYWDINREVLDSPSDDGQCTACHPSKAVDPEAHTFHPPASDGARCVSCHMPYRQHPEVGADIPFSRADHTIGVPRPAFDQELGLEGACAGCHRDRSLRELQRQVRAWWGEPKPLRPLIRGQIEERGARDVAEAAELLLLPGETDPLIQFQALARFVVAYLQPDALDLPVSVVTRLETLARSSDLDVRALALAALHWNRGDEPEVRRALVDALASAPAAEALRGRWVLALGFLGDYYRGRNESRSSEAAYRKALQLRPADPRINANLGLLYRQDGRVEGAVALFRESLVSDPNQPLTWVNLGIALAAGADVEGARRAYEEAIDLNPHEALAHFNLGNLHQRADRLTAAAASYRRAVASDPGLGQAHFELARTLIRLERYAEALPHARRAVEFLPGHAPSRQMLADLLQVVG